MKTTQWESCSEASIDAELYQLRKVRTNLSECIDVLPEEHGRRWPRHCRSYRWQSRP